MQAARRRLGARVLPWFDPLVGALLAALQGSVNFKIRLHAASALMCPRSSEACVAPYRPMGLLPCGLDS